MALRNRIGKGNVDFMLSVTMKVAVIVMNGRVKTMALEFGLVNKTPLTIGFYAKVKSEIDKKDSITYIPLLQVALEKACNPIVDSETENQIVDIFCGLVKYLMRYNANQNKIGQEFHNAATNFSGNTVKIGLR